MSAGTPVYPGAIDSDATLGPTSGIIAGQTFLNAVGAGQGDQLSITQNLISSVVAVQARVGTDNSLNPSSLEYRVRLKPFVTWLPGMVGTATASGAATKAKRNNRPVLVFPNAVVSSTELFGFAPLGTILAQGVVIRLKWLADTATVGDTVWSVALERLNTDQDTDSFDVAVTAASTTSASAGTVTELAITLPTIDGLVAGSPFALLVQRVGTDAGDTMAGNAQLQFVSIESADLMIVPPTLATVPLLNQQYGVATHFDQGWTGTLIPVIAQSGFGWIRDDMNWGAIESVAGTYNWTLLKGFWSQAIAQGLGVVCIIGGNGAYADIYDPTAMTNFCKILVTKIPGCVLEITNEPNNAYATNKGASWQSLLVTLTNQVRTGVHSVSPTTQVIGLGAQGTQIITMLAGGGVVDGIVYHPYEPNDGIPEHTFEPSFTDYETWVTALRTHTTAPIWETERNISTSLAGVCEYAAAVWNARRLLMSAGLSVEHTFIYDLADPGFQTVWTTNNVAMPTQTYVVARRIMAALNGTLPVANTVTMTSPSAGIVVGDLKGYVFSGGGRTVAAIWFGNHFPVKLATEFNAAAKTAFIAFPHVVPTEPIQTLDTVTGDLTFYPPANYGANGLFVTLSDRPLLITIQ